MEFVEKENHTSLRRNTPKCLQNWCWTIEGTTLLWNMLRNAGFSQLNLKYINQDPVENCFGQIRDSGHRNINPSPYQFGTAFKTLLTTNLTSRHSLSSNCEENEKHPSLTLLNMFPVSEIATLEKEEAEKDVECTEAAISETTVTYLFIDVQNILNILRNKFVTKCTECEQIINSQSMLLNIRNSIDFLEIKFPFFCHDTKLLNKLMIILNTEIFPVPMHCSHLNTLISKEIAQYFILEWCKFVNNILSGKMQDQIFSNFIYNEANRMSKRYLKQTVNKQYNKSSNKS